MSFEKNGAKVLTFKSSYYFRGLCSVDNYKDISNVLMATKLDIECMMTCNSEHFQIFSVVQLSFFFAFNSGPGF
jgi:hypothetical protein